MQQLALRTYAARPVQRVLTTFAGRRMFEAMYFGYKAWIEVPGAHTLHHYVRPGDWTVDVGANIGFFTEKFARWVSCGGKVIALEPETVNFGRLAARLRQQGLIDRTILSQGAAADSDGPLYLDEMFGHPGDHRISNKIGRRIEAWRLDTLWRQAGAPPIGLVKIDVQGAEALVLAGAASMIESRQPAVLIEIDGAALTAFGSSPSQVLGWLERRGYAFHRLTRGGPQPVGKAEILHLVAGANRNYCDVLALPILGPTARRQQ